MGSSNIKEGEKGEIFNFSLKCKRNAPLKADFLKSFSLFSFLKHFIITFL